MTNRYAIVLAAGKGTRMKSDLYKVLHPVCGKAMVQHVVDQLNKLNLTDIITIVGFGADQVEEQIGKQSKFVLQEKQLGTGHAVLQAGSILEDKEGVTLVVCGDTPLITHETFESLLTHHEETGAKATIMTADADNPTGYGRVLRSGEAKVEKIVEQKDANEEELKVREISTGTYCFDNKALFDALKQVTNDNSQGEYYLPDVIEILKKQGSIVSAYKTPNFEETLGINDRVALEKAENFLKNRINEKHMRNGVTLIDSNNTYIGPDVIIDKDTVIYPGTIISGETKIGKNNKIGPNTEIENCLVGNGTTVRQSVMYESNVGSNVSIGPFAHIRPNSEIGSDVKIGNFVEVKKSIFEDGSKASHLSYIGDAEVGKNVNIGCGTITVNYDGQLKYKTIIEDNAFIGCNSNLVAPVKIEKGAYVAAGSTITKDVPEGALSIGRSRQTNKEGYAERIKKQHKE